MPKFILDQTIIKPYLMGFNNSRQNQSALSESSSGAIENNLNCACFSGDTEVYVEGGGIKEIHYIGIGQKVLSRCEITGEIAYRKVIKTFEHEDVPCFHVIYSAYRERYPQGTKKASPLGGVISTAEHPFWVKSKGWTVARELQPGDELMSCDDTRVITEKVKPIDECTVYNLHVEGFHTYFVGCDAIWVHD